MTFPYRAFLRPRSMRLGVRKGLLATVLILSTAVLLPVPATAASQKELAKARSERAAVQRELDRTVAAYDAAQAKLAETQASMEANQKSLKEAEERQQAAQSRLSHRADAMYRRGPVAIFQFLFGAESLSDFGWRLTMVKGAARQDSATMADAARTTSEITALQQQLQAEEQSQQTLLTNMSAQTKALTDNFGKAQALESKLATDREAAVRAEREKAAKAAAAAKAAEAARAKEAAAKKKAPAAAASPSASAKGAATPSPATARLAQDGPALPVVSGATACPVAGPTSFTDTYGAFRGGGRTHQGVDMFAAMRTPVAAIVDGRILRRQTSDLGGLSVYLAGDDGNEYFYTHLAAYSDAAPGDKVKKGAIIGYVGDSGNAKGGPPHLHFEVRQGGVPINPTPTARKACG